MKPIDFIKNIPAGSPAGEILKIAAMITATILIEKIGEVIKDTSTTTNIPRYIEIKNEKED